MKTRIFGLIVKFMVAAAILSVLLLVAVKAYDFGKAVFDENPGTAENPRVVTFTVNEGDGVRQVAEALKEEKLIDSEWVFIVQKYFYSAKLLPGEYRLNSNMTGTDILDILSGAAVDTEESS